MPKIISFGGINPRDLKENPIKELWESFRALDKVAKIAIITSICLIIFGIYAATNLLETRQRAAGPTGSLPTVGAYYFGWFSPRNFTENKDYGFTGQWVNGVPNTWDTGRYGNKHLYAYNGQDKLGSERNIATDPWAGVRDLYAGNQ